MEQVAPGKMLAMCESGVALNPELIAKTGPKWLAASTVSSAVFWLGAFPWAHALYS